MSGINRPEGWKTIALIATSVRGVLESHQDSFVRLQAKPRAALCLTSTNLETYSLNIGKRVMQPVVRGVSDSDQVSVTHSLVRLQAEPRAALCPASTDQKAGNPLP